MNNALDKNAKLDVNISHLLATDEELEKLKELIIKRLGLNETSPKIIFESSNAKGNFYEVTFKILKPKSSDREVIKECLYSLNLVGWDIRGTYVP